MIYLFFSYFQFYFFFLFLLSNVFSVSWNSFLTNYTVRYNYICNCECNLINLCDTINPSWCKYDTVLPPSNSSILMIGNSYLREILEAYLFDNKFNLIPYAFFAWDGWGDKIDCLSYWVNGSYCPHDIYLVKFKNGATIHGSFNSKINIFLSYGKYINNITNFFGINIKHFNYIIINPGNSLVQSIRYYGYSDNDIIKFVKNKMVNINEYEYNGNISNIPKSIKLHSIESIYNYLYEINYTGVFIKVSQSYYENRFSRLIEKKKSNIFVKEFLLKQNDGGCSHPICENSYKGHQCIPGTPNNAAKNLFYTLHELKKKN